MPKKGRIVELPDGRIGKVTAAGIMQAIYDFTNTWSVYILNNDREPTGEVVRISKRKTKLIEQIDED